MENEVPVSFASDPPAAVMQCHVMEATQQDAAVDIRPALIALPFVDVMRLAVGRGAVTTSPATSTVSDGERDALSRREQPLFPADIKRLAAGVDGDRHE